MSFIGLMGFLCLCIIVAYKFNKELITVFPVCIGIWIFVLYVLAYFQILSWIDYVGAGVGVLFVLLYKFGEKDNNFARKNLILNKSTLLLFIIYLFLWFIHRNRVAWAGDDLGIWATEVKSLFYTNGFADKYENVALGYGDYYPGQMLFEWWVCHFDSKNFNEGLMYVGHAYFYTAFLAPILKIFDNGQNKRIALGGVL